MLSAWTGVSIVPLPKQTPTNSWILMLWPGCLGWPLARLINHGLIKVFLSLWQDIRKSLLFFMWVRALWVAVRLCNVLHPKLCPRFRTFLTWTLCSGCFCMEILPGWASSWELRGFFFLAFTCLCPWIVQFWISPCFEVFSPTLFEPIFLERLQSKFLWAVCGWEKA